MFRQGKLHADATLVEHANAAHEVLARGVCRGFGLAAVDEMTEQHWNAVAALWSLVHGYAHLAIAGKFEPYAGEIGLEAFVQRSLGPILDASLKGLFDAVPRAPQRPRRRR
jgi:adenosylmethionine-8-amino-7-oxononanoate aminotransferase